MEDKAPPSSSRRNLAEGNRAPPSARRRNPNEWYRALPLAPRRNLNQWNQALPSAHGSNLTAEDQTSPSASRRNLVDVEKRVLMRMEGLLNRLTPWNFEDINYRLIESVTGRISPFVLQGLVFIIFEMAVTGEAIISFSRLCYELSDRLPSFPSDEPGGKAITFKKVLLNACQAEFENAEQKMEKGRIADDDKQRFFGTLQFMAELFKHKMIPEKIFHHIIQELLQLKFPPEISIESVCQLFNSMGKEMDASPKSRRLSDIYFNKLKDLETNLELAPQIRVMVLKLLDLRANNWVKATVTTDILPRADENQGECFHSTATTHVSCGELEGTEQKPEPSLSENVHCLPASESEKVHNNIYEQLEKVMADVKILKEEACKERLGRMVAEKEAAEAIHKAGELESKYNEELKLRKETQDALEKTKRLLQVYKKD